MDVKEATSYGEQIVKLIKRDCIINSVEETLDILKRVNYYRLTAYFLPFLNKDEDKYIPNTEFYKVYKIYEFDQKLSVLLYSVIQEIEIFMKTQIAYYHSKKYGALGYINSNNFSQSKLEQHEKLIKALNSEIDYNSKMLFVQHHKTHYDGKFPLWVAVELFSMGNISQFYSQMITEDRKNVAKLISDITGQHTTYYQLSSWLRCLTDLRNRCAHFSRLYYYNFSSAPSIPNGFEDKTLTNIVKITKLYQYIFVLKFLYPQPQKWVDILTQFEALIDEYAEYIELSHIGFPTNWRNLLN